MDDTTVLLTIYSIVAGLAVAKLMEGVGMMIEARAHIRTYWMHSAWIVIIFASLIVTFFALMRFTKIQHWTVFGQLLLLGVPTMMYLASRLAIPPLENDTIVDLKDYFYRNCHWIQGMLLGASLCGMAGELITNRGIDRSIGGFVRVSVFLTLGLGMLTRRPVVLAVQVIALLGLISAAAIAVSIQLM